MLDIIFLPSVGKPDIEHAAEAFAPLIVEIWQAEQEERVQKLRDKQLADDTKSGDSVA